VENRRRVKELLDSFDPIREKHGCTFAQLVIAWTTHQPGLTHALVGARNREQAVENAKGGTIALSDDDLATMDAAVRGVGAAIV
jgi:aryl-alcohol dehydrogenase-like predicted oxidoreductase